MHTVCAAIHWSMGNLTVAILIFYQAAVNRSFSWVEQALLPPMLELCLASSCSGNCSCCESGDVMVLLHSGVVDVMAMSHLDVMDAMVMSHPEQHFTALLLPPALSTRFEKVFHLGLSCSLSFTFSTWLTVFSSAAAHYIKKFLGPRLRVISLWM